MKTKLELGKLVYSPVISSVWGSLIISASKPVRGLVKNSVSNPILNSTRWRIKL
jgi:hypothetical protein